MRVAATLHSLVHVTPARIAIGTLLALALAAGPAAAMPAARNAKPKILRASIDKHGRAVHVDVVARDRNDVIRGSQIEWGRGLPSQDLSSCESARRGRKQRLRLGYTYPAAGRYRIRVRVISGGCRKRPQQHSRWRRIIVRVR